VLAPVAQSALAQEEATRTPVVVSAGFRRPPAADPPPVSPLNVPFVEQFQRYLQRNPLDQPPPLPPQPVVIGWNPITFPSGTPVGGWATITIKPDGSWNFAGLFHDSGFPSYSDQIAVIVTGANGTAFSFEHSGEVGGTLGGSRDDPWNESGNNPALRDNFAALAGGGWQGRASVNWDLGQLLDEVKQAAGVIGAVIAIV
jgi:hypothetical protein